MPKHAKHLLLVLLITFVAACSGSTEPSEPDDSEPGMTDPGTTVEPGESETQQALLQKMQSARSVDADQLLSDRKVNFGGNIDYDPTQAGNLNLIQQSSLALTPDELDQLGQNAFVIAGEQEFPTFAYGYHNIYSQDLPVYITADSILFAVHKSYDDILKTSELRGLIPGVRGLLESMRDKLENDRPQGFDDQVYEEADFYLAVALSLLEGQTVQPVAGASPQAIQTFIDKATAHQGSTTIELFGADRKVDFSQFEPRGHYTDNEALERYFRTMIWLGRIDLRFLEPDMSGKLIFHRNQVEIAYLLHGLMDQQALEDWAAIDEVIGAFVGEQDNMSVDQFGPMLEDLDISSPEELAQLDDQTIVDTIQKHGYGEQRIMSHIMYNGMDGGTLPLSSSFLIFGQRYVPDSHVFANVVYDRVDNGSVYRMMPDPLDAAFGALANDHAVELLEPQLREHPYAGDLNAVRTLIDQYGEDFWDQNLYNRWMSALRALSPGSEVEDPGANGMPQVTGTEPWARRVLNTQMASWAELRHDTILYTKQSYTAGDACEFPDAYVDPYPEFYGELTQMAEHGQDLVEVLQPVVSDTNTLDRIDTYFAELANVTSTLRQLAESQRQGTPFTQEQMDFVNDMVVIHTVCGGDQAEGWYSRLFFDSSTATEYDPTIADVHTQPTEPGGAEVGRVLHVATGSPRLMVVTTDTCNGPRAYAAVVSSYFEKITENYERLTDEDWKDELGQGTPQDVDWMQDVVVR